MNESRLQRLLDEVPRDWHYCDREYDKWERYVSGLLGCLFGYTKFAWWTSDGDSFGPLVRTVHAMNRNGHPEEASYG